MFHTLFYSEPGVIAISTHAPSITWRCWAHHKPRAVIVAYHHYDRSSTLGAVKLTHLFNITSQLSPVATHLLRLSPHVGLHAGPWGVGPRVCAKVCVTCAWTYVHVTLVLCVFHASCADNGLFNLLKTVLLLKICCMCCKTLLQSAVKPTLFFFMTSHRTVVISYYCEIDREYKFINPCSDRKYRLFLGVGIQSILPTNELSGFKLLLPTT